jgi:Rha family phage regulatory protein
MSNLVFIENDRVVTDSLMVVEVFEKEHKNVLKDIRELGCSTEFRRLNFEQSSYRNSQNKEMPKFFITQDGFTLLAMGYTGKKAMEFKEKYIAVFFRMKEELSNLVQPSYMIIDPVKRAEKWIEEQREKQQLLIQNTQKDQIIGELRPKADYVDTVLKNKGLVTMTQIAKDYGKSAQEMNELLHELKVQYKQSGQWFLYSKYHSQGYTHSETINIKRSDGRPDVKMNTKWTQKGRLFLYELLKSKSVLPIIEQDEEESA